MFTECAAISPRDRAGEHSFRWGFHQGANGRQEQVRQRVPCLPRGETGPDGLIQRQLKERDGIVGDE